MRLSADQKALLERAAAVQGQDLTSFALGVLIREASEVVARPQTRVVTDRDMRALLRALERPAQRRAPCRLPPLQVRPRIVIRPEEWSIEPLGKRHRRESFDSGVPELDEFLKRYARQDQDRGISRTYVILQGGEPAVRGYYTLTGNALHAASFPDEEACRLPGYPLPVVTSVASPWIGACRGREFGRCFS